VRLDCTGLHRASNLAGCDLVPTTRTISVRVCECSEVGVHCDLLVANRIIKWP
jgi:hypothetical protein